MPGDLVFAIAQARDGSIAFGTDKGVGIFDGDSWTTFTDSLPSPAVRSLLQDRHGVWWIGTERGGLARYDGARWSVLNTAGGGLPDNQVNALLEDQTGDLWAGTAQGLLRRSSVSGSWQPIANTQLVNPQVNRLFEDRQRRLWIASPEGVTMADPTRTTWTRFTKNPSFLAEDSVLSIGEDRDGGIWFGAVRGYDSTSFATRLAPDGTWQYHTQAGGLPSPNMNAIVRDASGGLWFAGGNGMARFDGRTFDPVTATFGGESLDRATALLVDDPGSLWVGTNGHGAFRSDGTGYENFVTPLAACDLGLQTGVPLHTVELPSNCLSDLLEDHRGERWFATLNAGIARLDPAGRWSTVRAGPGQMASDAVNVLLEDPAGTLWVGTSDAGLSSWNSTRSQWSHFSSASSGLVGDNVTALSVDASGALWVGGSAGVSRRNGNGWIPVFQAGSGGFTVPLLVSKITEDAERTVWIRTNQGLWSVSSDRLTLVRHGLSTGLPDDRATALLRASDGTIWVGTPQGIAHRASGAWVTWGTPAVGVGPVVALSEGRTGSVWAAGLDGVAVREGSAWHAYGVATVGFGPVNQILQDSHGRMWFGGQGGFGTWNLSQWRHVEFGRGIASPDIQKMMEDSQGHLWLIGIGGLTLVEPDRAGPQTVFRLPPASIITRRNVSFAFGAAYGETADLEFLPSWDDVAETNWSTATSFTQTNISDGIHTFAVRARDWSRNEDPSPATITFEVDATPPQTVISAPSSRQPVRGLVSIEGSSADARYLSDRVEVRRVGAPSWTVVGTSVRAVTADTLASWDTSTFPDGDYEIRLLVQDSLGVEGAALVRVIVDNVAPFANVTSPVVVRASQGGDVFTTGSEVHVYVPPLGFDADATVSLEPDTSGTLPATLADGAVLAAPGWQLAWGQSQLVHPGTLEMRVPAGESRPLAVYTERTPGTWVRLGGAPTSSGAPLAVSLTAAGRYALYAGGASGSTSSLGAVSLVPRAFSPRGSFGSRDVAIGFTLGRSASVSVKVFNRAGRLLRVVADGLGQPAGAGVVRWDGRDHDGQMVEEGLYLVTVEALGELSTQTLAVVR